MAFDQQGYVIQYRRDNYDSIQFYVPKGKKKLIKQKALDLGISVTEMVQRALEEKYDLDLSKTTND